MHTTEKSDTQALEKLKQALAQAQREEADLLESQHLEEQLLVNEISTQQKSFDEESLELQEQAEELDARLEDAACTLKEANLALEIEKLRN